MRFTTIPLAFITLLSFGCGTADPVSERVGQTPPTLERSTVETEDAATSLVDLVPNGKEPSENLITGGQPDPDQLADLAEGGLSTVINLRTEGESGNTESDLIESLGMNYVSIPIGGAEDLTEANARLLAEALEQAESPVLLHCGSGNRVGALLAMKAFYVDEMSAEDALALGTAAGVTKLEPVLRSKLALPES